MAGLRDYSVVDLLDRSGAEDAMFQPDYRSTVKQMVETAPPDAVFLIDSRIPLPGLYERSEVERHLLHLRAIAPASLDSVPLGDIHPDGESTGAAGESGDAESLDETKAVTNGDKS